MAARTVALTCSETLFGRALPGFSSDAIRLDQARSSRRIAASAQRAAKLKLVNDAKSSWRKEREDALKAADAEQASAAQLTAEPGAAEAGGEANGVSYATTPAPSALGTLAPPSVSVTTPAGAPIVEISAVPVL